MSEQEHMQRLLIALQHGATIDFVAETRVWYFNGERMSTKEIEAMKALNDRLVWVADWNGGYFDKSYPEFHVKFIEDETV